MNINLLTHKSRNHFGHKTVRPECVDTAKALMRLIGAHNEPYFQPINNGRKTVQLDRWFIKHRLVLWYRYATNTWGIDDAAIQEALSNEHKNK